MEQQYRAIPDNEQDDIHGAPSEDCDTLLPEKDESLRQLRTGARRRAWIPALFITVALLTATIVGTFIGRRWPVNLNSTCTQHVSRYSPVLEDVDITYNTIRFNGSLLKENVYRQDAGPEVDEAWEALGVDYHSVIVPEDLAAKSGLAPDQVKVNKKYGGGYPANVEGLHQLHCLNLLRQSLYYNYDHYHSMGTGAFRNDDNIVRYHVSHCLDILRQQLMCTVDIGVLGQVWWDQKSPKAYVDFNTRHTCRNFDAVRQWAYEHQAPGNPPKDYLEPPKKGDRIYETIP